MTRIVRDQPERMLPANPAITPISVAMAALGPEIVVATTIGTTKATTTARLINAMRCPSGRRRFFVGSAGGSGALGAMHSTVAMATAPLHWLAYLALPPPAISGWPSPPCSVVVPMIVVVTVIVVVPRGVPTHAGQPRPMVMAVLVMGIDHHGAGGVADDHAKRVGE